MRVSKEKRRSGRTVVGLDERARELAVDDEPVCRTSCASVGLRESERRQREGERTHMGRSTAREADGGESKSVEARKGLADERGRKRKGGDAHPSGLPMRSSIVNQYSRRWGLALMFHLGERRSSLGLLMTLGRDGGGRGLCGQFGLCGRSQPQPPPDPQRMSSSSSWCEGLPCLPPLSLPLEPEMAMMASRELVVDVGVGWSGTVSMADDEMRGAVSLEPQTTQSGYIVSQKVPLTPDDRRR